MPDHTWIILTKRPRVAQDFFKWLTLREAEEDWIMSLRAHMCAWGTLPRSVHFGVTAESQEWANNRIPVLLDLPVTTRWVSVEPMLEPVNLRVLYSQKVTIDALAGYHGGTMTGRWNRLDWVVCGAETGPGKRPFEPEWAMSLRDQCRANGVPFFFKRGAHGERNLGGVLYQEIP